MVSQLIGSTEQRNRELETVEEELSLALSAEETLEDDDLQDDLPLPDPAEPMKDQNHDVAPAKRNQKRANVHHEESRSKRIKRVPAKFLP